MKTPESADCPQFLDNLERLMNGGMSEIEEKEFLASIAPSIECIERVEMEKAYKDFLISKLERKSCNKEMISRLKSITDTDA